jgi:putative transposon-encoded protein
MSIQCLDMEKHVSLREIDVKELIEKKVAKSGNGGAVWVPKRWLGEKVVIILPRKKK